MSSDALWSRRRRTMSMWPWWHATCRHVFPELLPSTWNNTPLLSPSCCCCSCCTSKQQFLSMHCYGSWLVGKTVINTMRTKPRECYKSEPLALLPPCGRPAPHLVWLFLQEVRHSLGVALGRLPHQVVHHSRVCLRVQQLVQDGCHVTWPRKVNVTFPIINITYLYLYDINSLRTFLLKNILNDDHGHHHKQSNFPDETQL